MATEEVQDTSQHVIVEVASRVSGQVRLRKRLGNALERVEHHPASFERRHSFTVQSQIGPERLLSVLRVGLRAKTDDSPSAQAWDKILAIVHQKK